MSKLALGVIDPERGFMPAAEGIRLAVPGFGELPVPGGEEIVPQVNALLAAYEQQRHYTFTTQDWHPLDTAHFSDNPDYKTNWPIHCLAGTPGAELHPGIVVPSTTEAFRKGMEALERGEDDQSYSGYFGVNEHGVSLGDRLLEQKVAEVALTGLAIDYCVGRTALDVRKRLGLDVIVAIDATRGIAEESTESMLEQFAREGIKVMDTNTLLAHVRTA